MGETQQHTVEIPTIQEVIHARSPVWEEVGLGLQNAKTLILERGKPTLAVSCENSGRGDPGDSGRGAHRGGAAGPWGVPVRDRGGKPVHGGFGVSLGIGKLWGLEVASRYTRFLQVVGRAGISRRMSQPLVVDCVDVGAASSFCPRFRG